MIFTRYNMSEISILQGAFARAARTDGDLDPTSPGTAGNAALWAGSSAVVGMAANPLGAHQVG